MKIKKAFVISGICAALGLGVFAGLAANRSSYTIAKEAKAETYFEDSYTMTALELYNSTSSLWTSTKQMITDANGTYVRFSAAENGNTNGVGIFFETPLMLDLSQRCSEMLFDVRISDYSTFKNSLNCFNVQFKALADDTKRSPLLWCTTSFVERSVAVNQGTEKIYGFVLPSASDDLGCYVEIRSVTFSGLTGIEKHNFLSPWSSASWNNYAVNADLDVYGVLMQYDGTVPETRVTNTLGYDYFRYVVDHILVNGENMNDIAKSLTNLYMYDASHTWFVMWYPGARVGNLDSSLYISAPTFEVKPGTWLCPGHVAQGAFMTFNRTTGLWERNADDFDAPIYTVSDLGKASGNISLGTSANIYSFFNFNSQLEGTFGVRLNFNCSDVSKVGENILLCSNDYTGGYHFTINSAYVYIVDGGNKAVTSHGMTNGVDCSIGLYVINLDNDLVKLCIVINGVLKNEYITTQAATIGHAVLWSSNNYNGEEYATVTNDTTSYDAAIKMFARRHLGGLTISTADSGTGLCTSSGSYDAAKTYYNNKLTANQRSVFSSVNPVAYQRLAAWAAANGDTFDANHNLVARASNNIIGVIGNNGSNAAITLIVVVAFMLLTAGGVFYICRRKQN